MHTSYSVSMRVLITVDVCKVVDSVADIFERQAKERQLRTAENRAKAESVVVALVPQQEIEPETPITESKEEPAQFPPEPKKPEPKARDLAVAAVGNQVSARTQRNPNRKKVKAESPIKALVP